jgi:ABC-2 type transport system permease protein
MSSPMQAPLRAWLNNTVMSLKLTYRDRQAIFWTYIFPLFFLFLFASVFARGRAEVVTGLMAGLLCISSMSAGLFGMSINLVMMRERGILRRYRLAPVSPLLVISSELVAGFIVLLSTLVLQLMLAAVIYRMRIAGNLLVMLLMLSVGALTFLAIGFIVASVAENVRAAQVMSNLLFFPLMFLGGAAFPLAFLPQGLQNVSRLLPSQYMVEGLRRVMVEGAGLRAILPYLGVLAITFAVAAFLATKLFRWEAREPLPWAKKAWVGVLLVIFVTAALLMKR